MDPNPPPPEGPEHPTLTTVCAEARGGRADANRVVKACADRSRGGPRVELDIEPVQLVSGSTRYNSLILVRLVITR
jgi:hypothetical protein